MDFQDTLTQSNLVDISTCLGGRLHVWNTPLTSSALCHVHRNLTSLLQVHLVAYEQEWNPLVTLYTQDLLSVTTHTQFSSNNDHN